MRGQCSVGQTEFNLNFFAVIWVALVHGNGDNVQTGRFKVHLSAADNRLTLAKVLLLQDLAGPPVSRIASVSLTEVWSVFFAF